MCGCGYLIYMHTVPCWVTHPPQRVGLTTELPENVPERLLNKTPGSHEWYLSDNFGYCGLYHNNKETKFLELPLLKTLTPGQSVGLLVTPNGQLHLFFDGKHHLEIATGLPVDIPLLGVASVHGTCTKIKSEIMSGELCGVVISPSQCVGGVSDTERVEIGRAHV